MLVKIYDYGMTGEGVGKSEDGKLLFVHGALVGEEVEAQIIDEKTNYAFALPKKIVTESKNRTQPPCPYFNECGGCDLQHMTYSEQLKFKASLVKKTLKKVAGLDVEIEKIVPSDKQFNYRNKLSLNVGSGKVGFFKKNSHDIIDINYCRIASEKINEIIKIFRKYISNKEKEFSFNIKNLVIREIDGQILVGVVTKSFVDINDFYDILKKDYKDSGLYLIVNTRKDSVVLDGQVKFVGGLTKIKIKNFDLIYDLDLMSFHQTNIDVQNKIYADILSLVPAGAHVVNGFSGAGLLTALISKKANEVFGIEIEKSSHKDAEILKQTNGIKNMTNIQGDFLKKFPPLTKTCDTLILDPSKKGCGEKIMREIFDIKRIIYISCNPIALAKDLRILTKNYTIDKVYIYDMFPATANVETLISLKLKE